MAVSESQIVDLLYKQAFGVTKTDTANIKSPSNESIPSPLLLRGDTVWTQADQIPGTPAGVANIVQAYTGASAVECAPDTTTVPIGGIYPTWKTNLTYWIPPQFGPLYNVQIWIDNSGVANPTLTGTQIFAAGSGGTGQYYYNYQSGVLNFIGETIPAALTSGKVLYVVGYRYIGKLGVTNLPSNTSIGNLSVTGTTITSLTTNGNINLNPNGSGIVVANANIVAPYFVGNFSGNISGNITIPGTNTGVVFNDSNLANSSSAFTFDKTTNVVTMTGNVYLNQAIATNTTLQAPTIGSYSGERFTIYNFNNVAKTNYAIGAENNYLWTGVDSNANTVGFKWYGNTDLAATLTGSGNLVLVGGLTGNFATVSGNVLGNNLNANANITAVDTVRANFIHANANVLANTVNVNLVINGNVANFTGNLNAANVAFGNLLTGNYANFNNDVVVQGNIANANNISVTNLVTANNANITSNVNAGNANIAGNLVTNNANINLALNGNTAIFSGNVEANNLDVNLLLTGNTANFTGNINVLGIKTDNYYYANGAPVDFEQPGGSNTDIQFNDNGDLGGVSQFTFDKATNTLSVLGNANLTTVNTSNINGGANPVYINANGFSTEFAANGNVYFPSNVNVASNISAQYFLGNFSGNISGNVQAGGSNTQVQFNDGGNINGTAGFTFDKTSNLVTIAGNLSAANTAFGNLLTGNYGNFTNDLVVQANIANANNISATNGLFANNANITSNITSGNANLGNLATANYFTGVLINGTSNVTVNNNGNVDLTAGGNLSLVVKSTGANVTGNIDVSAAANAAHVYTPNVTSTTGALTLTAAAGNNNIDLKPTGNGTVDVANTRITNLAEPVAATDAATKQYVDSVAEGLHVHAPCQAATTATLATISGGTVTYNNGAAGVGANLVTTGSFTTIDGVNIASIGTRILVKDEVNAAHNGIYVYTNSTTLTRASDFDTPSEMAGGDFTFIQQGSIYNDTGWVMTDPVITVGTSPVNWLQFSGAGTYSAGAGLTLTGTVFSVNVDNITTEISAGNVVVKANAQLTTPNIGDATGTSLVLTGNVTAGNVVANNISSAANLTVTNFANVGNLNATGNITGNNANITANLTAGNANIVANLTSGNANLGNLATANYANISVDLHVSGNSNLGNVATANTFVGVLANGTSNVAVLQNGNINLTAAGNTSLVVTPTGANVTGTFGVTGNLTVANANLGNLVTANYFTGILANGTSQVAIPTANGNVNISSGANSNVLVISPNGINVAGYGNFTGNVDANNLTLTSNVVLGTTTVRQQTSNTASLTADQVIATAPVSGVTGIEFIVKGVDSTGGKYSMATISVVTDGTAIDWQTYGSMYLGGTTGTYSAGINGSNVELRVTPSSTNTTTWTTQFRTI